MSTGASFLKLIGKLGYLHDLSPGFRPRIIYTYCKIQTLLPAGLVLLPMFAEMSTSRSILMIHLKKKCSRLNVRSLQPVLFNKPKANTAAEPQDFM